MELDKHIDNYTKVKNEILKKFKCEYQEYNIEDKKEFFWNLDGGYLNWYKNINKDDERLHCEVYISQGSWFLKALSAGNADVYCDARCISW